MNMKVIKYVLLGAGLGLAAAVALIIVGLGLDFLSCACSVVTCEFDASANCMSFVVKNFGGISVFCMIGGAIIGYFYGLVKSKDDDDVLSAKLRAEREAEEKKLRVKLATELKETVLKVSNDCRTIEKENSTLLGNAEYKSSALMTQISLELANVAELEGEIDAMANDALN